VVYLVEDEQGGGFFCVADDLLLFHRIGQDVVGQDDTVPVPPLTYGVSVEMYADGSQLLLDLTAKVTVRHEPYDPADVAGADELQEGRPSEQGLPGARRGGQGSETAVAQNRQNARRTFVLPLPGDKVRKRQDGRFVVTVGADSHSVVYIGGTAADPRNDVMDMKHVGKVALADTADVMLPGGDSSAFGGCEQPPRIPGTAAQRDPRRPTRMASSLSCSVDAPMTSISGARSVPSTPP
jgi:hypothetical protein